MDEYARTEIDEAYIELRDSINKLTNTMNDLTGQVNTLENSITTLKTSYNQYIHQEHQSSQAYYFALSKSIGEVNR